MMQIKLCEPEKPDYNGKDIELQALIVAETAKNTVYLKFETIQETIELTDGEIHQLSIDNNWEVNHGKETTNKKMG